MELIRHLHNLRPAHRGCVATIGNFDGVHTGHQQVLAGLRARADALALPTVAMTFEPLPREHFGGDACPARLTTLREKLPLLAAAGVDRVLVCRFDGRFSSQPPEAFVSRWLVNGLGVRHLVVGDDFRFGARAAGDFNMLVEAGAEHGFEVQSTRTWLSGDARVSSTRVRDALAAGDLALAEKLLGRPYTLSGRVIRGDALGRTLGFPTANLKPGRRVLPVSGVFVVGVSEVGEPDRFGVCNVGSRPTVNGIQPRVEVHVFDTERDYYGHHLRLTLRHRLRPEQRFASLDALKAAIADDARAARDWVARSA
ncbi:MAG: bifunctional riboflavin kinase/FAD synthetase [Pseudomonadota bacterium]